MHVELHDEFVEKSFAINDASILAALAPVIALQCEGDDETFDATARDYLRRYAEHLGSIDERDYVVALRSARLQMAANLKELDGHASQQC